MADRPRPPRGPLRQRPRPPQGPLATDTHDTHDTLLIAAYAAGDLGGGEARRAAGLIGECGACAELAVDLASIATATAALPPPQRPRDFSIAPDQAARLRRGGWRGVLDALTAPRSVLAPRLAGTLTALGVAGLLLASVPGLTLDGGGAMGTLSGPADRNAITEQASPAPGQVPLAPPDFRAEGTFTTDHDAQPPSDIAGAPKSGDLAAGQPGSTPGGSWTADRLPLVLLSSAFLALGLGIFAVRSTARGSTLR